MTPSALSYQLHDTIRCAAPCPLPGEHQPSRSWPSDSQRDRQDLRPYIEKRGKRGRSTSPLPMSTPSRSLASGRRLSASSDDFAQTFALNPDCLSNPEPHSIRRHLDLPMNGGSNEFARSTSFPMPGLIRDHHDLRRAMKRRCHVLLW